MKTIIHYIFLFASVFIFLNEPTAAQEEIGFANSTVSGVASKDKIKDVQSKPLELNNGIIHIKLDLNAGGAIGYLSESGTNYNLINTDDRGRYIQQSYYAGQARDRIKEGQSAFWSPWNWNPIQVGDFFHNSSKVLNYSNDGHELYVQTQPLLWDMNNELGECNFETWVSIEDNVAHVRNKLTVFRTDDFWFDRPAHQELPAMYTNENLTNLYTYTGSKPWTLGQLDKIENNGPPWIYWNSKEHWAAYVNNFNWGVGVYNKSCELFVGGFYNFFVPGKKNYSTGYISPLNTVTLSKNSVFEYNYDLIVGTIAEIRSYVYQKEDIYLKIENNEYPVTIFPNPLKGNDIYISGINEKTATIQIIDITSRLVYSEKYQGQTDLVIHPNLSPGIYLVIVNTSSGTKLTKLVVN